MEVSGCGTIRIVVWRCSSRGRVPANEPTRLTGSGIPVARSADSAMSADRGGGDADRSDRDRRFGPGWHPRRWTVPDASERSALSMVPPPAPLRPGASGAVGNPLPQRWSRTASKPVIALSMRGGRQAWRDSQLCRGQSAAITRVDFDPIVCATSVVTMPAFAGSEDARVPTSARDLQDAFASDHPGGKT